MAQYEKKILNALLDSYEKSLLYSGENRVRVRVSFPFSKKTIPGYFEEGSLEYEEIHACVEELERKGLLDVVWKKGRIGHIIQKVCLVEEKIPDAYRYLNRTPKRSSQDQMEGMLRQAAGEYRTPVCSAFVRFLLERLEDNRSIKEYVELSDPGDAEKLIRTIWLIETNETPCYVREFSIHNFSDSKAFEEIAGRVARVMRRFGSESEEKSFLDILADYGIYHTPNYVYLKGNLSLELEGKLLEIGELNQGIGVSGEDIGRLSLRDTGSIRKVLTIENLTTFFRWREEDCLILYLGGYHNSVRRALLKRIYRQLPEAAYYHFGDIDAGGFEIYEDLCRKTEIPFQLYRMDAGTLEKYGAYGKTLTENDKKRIKKMLERGNCPYENTLRYMLEKDRKLEQECIEVGTD